LEPGGFIFVIGTRYNFDDLYGWILKGIQSGDKSWHPSIRKAWTKIFKKDAKGKTTKEIDEIRLLFPKRFTVEQLLELERVDPVFFAYQYLNSPIVSGRELFPPELIEAHTILFEKVPQFGAVVIVWDLASSQGVDRDQSVGIAARIGKDNVLYIVDIRAGQFLPQELIQHIYDMSLKWRPVKVALEKSAGATYLLPGLDEFGRKHGLSLPLEWIQCKNSKNAKISRIEGLHPVISNGQLKFFAGIPHYEELTQQFKKFPKGRHDDFPDAVSLLLELMPSLSYGNAMDTHPAFRTTAQTPQPDDGFDGGLGSLGSWLLG
jgi:predicted phage terminase large subunit-like protein